eukprot:COSAG01_NODE_3235_length_6375_cov_12.478808_7_plen_70_part_00
MKDRDYQLVFRIETTNIPIFHIACLGGRWGGVRGSELRAVVAVLVASCEARDVSVKSEYMLPNVYSGRG